MGLWDYPDPNQYSQQASDDPFLNEMFAMRDGFSSYSTPSYMPPADSSYLSSRVEPAKKKVRKAANKVINSPDGTQRRPITRIPVEVWNQILKRCIPSREENDKIPSLSRRKAPMQLTAITKGLRNIALSMPELWTTVSLVPRGRNPYGDGEIPSPDMLEQYLQRSKDRPLSISVAGHHSDLDYVFWKLAKWSAKRWEHLSVMPTSIDGKEGRWKRYTFPRLKSVNIKGGPQNAWNKLPECLASMIKHSDSLRSFSWTNFQPAELQHTSKMLQNATLPIGKLTSLKLHNALFSFEALEMLTKATMLKDLELTALRGMRPPNVYLPKYPRKPIQLLNLESLSVNASRFEESSGPAVGGSLDELLPYIFAPNLQSLTVGYNDDGRSPFLSLQTFLTVSRCRLSSLAFSFTPLSSEHLLWILTHFTAIGSLQSLTLLTIPGKASPLSPEVIPWLMPSSQCLVPTLRSFSFNITALNSTQPGTVTSVLKQRCKMRPRFLRKIHIEGVREVERQYAPLPEVSWIRDLASKYRLSLTSN